MAAVCVAACRELLLRLSDPEELTLPPAPSATGDLLTYFVAIPNRVTSPTWLSSAGSDLCPQDLLLPAMITSQQSCVTHVAVLCWGRFQVAPVPLFEEGRGVRGRMSPSVSCSPCLLPLLLPPRCVGMAVAVLCRPNRNSITGEMAAIFFRKVFVRPASGATGPRNALALRDPATYRAQLPCGHDSNVPRPPHWPALRATCVCFGALPCPTPPFPVPLWMGGVWGGLLLAPRHLAPMSLGHRCRALVLFTAPAFSAPCECGPLPLSCQQAVFVSQTGKGSYLT
ncbi:hypothetical protein NDU88_007203 [Pleurodeles waltl]|uniref:Uncharacterized protein n=1 Tax=Pleurodeles waltl TaxID=8319 RepID=A0AAV7RSA5_PLEWA|nr:hypothetical protein NDU88_007203 [Pleurodeles waltl]